MNLPVNCRLQGRTLKLDVLADILIKFVTWTEAEGRGEAIETREERMV